MAHAHTGALVVVMLPAEARVGTSSQDPHTRQARVGVTKSYALVLPRREHNSSTLENVTDREALPLDVARCSVGHPSLLRGVAR